MRASAEPIPFGKNLTHTLNAASPPLLYALRLWASVCLALYIAFWLQLDNPFWAGTSAAIVCQPQLGASLRKGWFRMIGTVIGAATIVVLTALFPQDRIGFLVLLAVWGGICAFTATVLHNFASYSAALAGYTAAIIAADTLGATGGPSPDVFMLAVWRTSEICIGIVCAGVVLVGTDFGGAQRRLATSLADLATEILGGFSRTLAMAGPQLPETQSERRELIRRVIVLDPIIDQALGEFEPSALPLADLADGRIWSLQSDGRLAGRRDAFCPFARGRSQGRGGNRPAEHTTGVPISAKARLGVTLDDGSPRAAPPLPGGGADTDRSTGWHAIAKAPRRRDSQGAVRHAARARWAGAPRRCS